MSDFDAIHSEIRRVRGLPLEVQWEGVSVFVRRPTWGELLQGGKLPELVERHCISGDGDRLFGADDVDRLPADLVVLLDRAIGQVYDEAANPQRPCGPSSGSHGPSV